ncbi:MAG: hypothetical protein V7K76_24460 [Nostoc sp.]
MTFPALVLKNFSLLSFKLDFLNRARSLFTESKADYKGKRSQQ